MSPHHCPPVLAVVLAVSAAALVFTGIASADQQFEGSISVNGNIETNAALHMLGTSTETEVTAQPRINWWNNGSVIWQTALDVSNSLNQDFVLAAKIDPATGDAGDVVYLRSYDQEGTAIGLNSTPPAKARVAIGNASGGSWPSLLIALGEEQSGEAIRIEDSAGHRLASWAADGSLKVDRIAPATDEPFVRIRGLEIQSTSKADPNSLRLNGDPTNSSTDIMFRNIKSSAFNDYFLQIGTTTDPRSILTGSRNTGFVGLGGVVPTAPLDVAGNRIRVRDSKTPSSSSAPCDRGEMSWDADYVYVCIADNTWKRSKLESWGTSRPRR
jgi:hypothetical protein